MLTKVRHTLNAACLLAVMALTVVVVCLTGSAGATGGRSFASGALVAPLPGSQGVVSPSLLIRNGEGSFGSFSGESPQALTVDQATGDIYAIEPSAGKLWRFASNGTAKNFTAGPDAGTNSLTGLSFQGFPGLDQVAVDSSPGPAKGDIYVTESGMHRVKVFASSGEPLATLTGSANGGLGEDCGIAVDESNGDVYIANRGFSIWRYTPTSNPVSEADYSGGVETAIEPCQLAVAGSSLYVKQWQEFPIAGAGPLDKLSTSAFVPEQFGFGSGPVIAQNVTAIATDPSTGDVYADFGNKITVFNSAGASLYSFGSSRDFGGESVGVTVDSSSGSAYVADPLNHRIDVYGPAVVAPPTATTGEASQVRHVKATLNGHLDLNEGPEVTDCHFDWGTTTAYGNTAPCDQGNTYTGPAEVSATITGLEPGKTYHYRLVASAETNVGTGSDQTFETVPVPIVYGLTSTFGASGSGDGQFSGNSGVAVDQATGAVYVADTANHRVEKLDSNGTFVAVFGWGVKDGKPEAETCTSGCQAGIAGSGAGQLATPTFIAVDNSGGPSNGDVYVGDTTSNTVTKYDADGNYISTNDGTASGTAFGPLAGIAVSTKGDLWVYDAQGNLHVGYMHEFSQDGTFTTQWSTGNFVTPAGVAIDASETLYIGLGEPGIWRYSTSGEGRGGVTDFPSSPRFNGPPTGLAIDPTSGDLYVDMGGTRIRQYTNPATCVSQINSGIDEGCAVNQTFAVGELNAASGIAVKASNARLYVSDPDTVKVYEPSTPPDLTIGTASATSATSATLTGTVGPNGLALTDCHFEYVSDAAFLATGFTDLSSGGTAPCTPSSGSIPADLEDHTVTANITGLDPATIYHVRLVATNTETTAHSQQALIPGIPLVETTGSPTRTATTARLDSRLDPRSAATSYHFEYGDQGPCDTNPCNSTPTQAAGDGETYGLVSQQITSLKANTTYHYRLVADNGIPDGTAYGQDATITTRQTDAPLTHGHLPGPPDSDRAWEQVNIPNTSGNEVDYVPAISDSGERVVYDINGGSPGSQYGGGLFTGTNIQYAERSAHGWQNRSLFPVRSEAPGNEWLELGALSDLSQVFALNADSTGVGPAETWRLSPGATPQRVLSVPIGQVPLPGGFTVVSADGSRVLSVLKGNLDSKHPVGSSVEEFYDITTGTPHMIGLLPDGSTPSCGVSKQIDAPPAQGFMTPDGSFAFFVTYEGTSCSGPLALYVRNLADSTTSRIAAQAKFIRSTDGYAYFTTMENLDPSDHGGNDVYRYGIRDGSLDCLTCSTAAAGSVRTSFLAMDFGAVAVSDDGSRIYFGSSRRLLQGASSQGIYRLNVSRRELAFVAPIGAGTRVGSYEAEGNALTPDGSVFVFQSENTALDAVNGPQNGGGLQDYRYDDNDRSLVCVSCPDDGALPRGSVPPQGLAGDRPDGWPGSPLTSSGDLVFVTPTPLVAVDQNTALPSQRPVVGDDVYEWRDGRQLLVTDGQTYNVKAPLVAGASRSGRDVFFTQAAQLTPDAIDNQAHLYDARVGGGFEFPSPAVPCSLEACQGIASPPPNDGTPASLSFSGPGNQAGNRAASKQCGSGACVKSHAPKKRCAKGKVLRRGRCVKKVQHKRKRVKRTSRNHGGAK